MELSDYYNYNTLFIYIFLRDKVPIYFSEKLLFLAILLIYLYISRTFLNLVYDFHFPFLDNVMTENCFPNTKRSRYGAKITFHIDGNDFLSYNKVRLEY